MTSFGKTATLRHDARHILLHVVQRLRLVPLQHRYIPLSILVNPQFRGLAEDPALLSRAAFHVQTQSREMGGKNIFEHTRFERGAHPLTDSGQLSVLQ